MSADAHQDLYARQFCGEGAPDWAVNVGKYSLPFPMPVLGTTVLLPNHMISTSV